MSRNPSDPAAIRLAEGHAEVLRLANVLAEHQMRRTGCTCGWGFPRGSAGHLFRLHREHVATALLAEPDAELDIDCEHCEEETDARCKGFTCPERQGGRHTEWWCEFGCCSPSCAIDYYGKEAVV